MYYVISVPVQKYVHYNFESVFVVLCSWLHLMPLGLHFYDLHTFRTQLLWGRAYKRKLLLRTYAVYKYSITQLSYLKTNKTGKAYSTICGGVYGIHGKFHL
jgi:hypothetical protein